MKQLFFCLFLVFIAFVCNAQLIKSDSMLLPKDGYFAGIFSKKDKGLVIVNQDKKDDSYVLTFYNEFLENKWDVRIKEEDFKFDSRVLYYPFLLCTDNYIYFYVINKPDIFYGDMNKKEYSKVFYQVSYDGEAKKGNITLQKNEEIINYFATNDTLLAYYQLKKIKSTSDQYVEVCPDNVSVEKKIRIAPPSEGWRVNEIKGGWAYYLGIDDINPNFNLQKRLKSNTVSGKGYAMRLSDRSVKQLAYEFTSAKFKPCPDYCYRKVIYSTDYDIESPFTNFQYDLVNKDLYIFGMLSGDTYSNFYKKGFYILKYKTSGRKVYSKTYDFDTLGSYNEDFVKFISSEANYKTNLLADGEYLFYFISTLNNSHAVIQMNNNAEIRKIVIPDNTGFGAWDDSAPYLENLCSWFYTNVEYKEGDDLLLKNINDVRSLYKNKKKPVSMNVYRLTKSDIIAVLNKNSNKLIFYQVVK